MFKNSLLFLSLLFMGTGCAQKKDKSEALAKKISVNDSTLWIDVRSVSEFKSGHFKYAIHIPHRDIADKIADVASNKQQVIKLYCAAGGRSSMAMSVLRDLGYVNVSNEGGLDDVRRKYKE